MGRNKKPNFKTENMLLVFPISTLRVVQLRLQSRVIQISRKSRLIQISRDVKWPIKVDIYVRRQIRDQARKNNIKVERKTWYKNRSNPWAKLTHLGGGVSKRGEYTWKILRNQTFEQWNIVNELFKKHN